MARPSPSPLALALVTLVLTLTAVYAHVALTYPPARKYDLDFLDNSRTRGPCGMPKGKQSTDPWQPFIYFFLAELHVTRWLFKHVPQGELYFLKHVLDMY